MAQDWQPGIDALLQQAEREGKWLYSAYQDLWFSPRQLREHQANGRFRWGAFNWTLRDPAEMIEIAEKAVEAAVVNRFKLKQMVHAEAQPSPLSGRRD